MKNWGIPREVVDAQGAKWVLSKYDPGTKVPFTYSLEGSTGGLCLAPYQVEHVFTRVGRPEPKSKIVIQGKYECAAASLAMLLNEPLFAVKRAMGKAGWRNDNQGAGDQIMIDAARSLGRDILKIGKYQLQIDLGPASLTLPSLNYKGMSHAVTWTGKEVLDPNWGKEGRKFWGCEWNPETIGATSALILLPKNLTEEQRKRQDKFQRQYKTLGDIRRFSEQILKEIA